MAFPTTNLLARYEAKLDTGHVDGDALATIPDQSGAGRDLTQGTVGNRPVYKTGIVNGQPAYRLDGAGDCAQRAEALSLTAASLTVVLSSEPTEDPARSWPFGVYDDGASLPRIFAFTEAATAGEWGSFVRTSVTTLQQSTSGADTTGWTVLTLTWDGTTAALYRNGTLVNSGSIGGTLESINTLSLGALTAATFGGDVALAALYNTALGATERADLHSYVQDTYGIAVSDYVSSGGTLHTVTLSATSLASSGFSDRLRLPRTLAALEISAASLAARLLRRLSLPAVVQTLPVLGGSPRGTLAAVAAALASLGRRTKASRAAQVQALPSLSARRLFSRTLASIATLSPALFPQRAARKQPLAATVLAAASLTSTVSYGTGTLPTASSSAQALALYKALIAR